MLAMLERGESWLIEMAVRWQLPICGLARSDENLHLWLLRGGHGLSTDRLLITLRRMFDAGYITATIDEIEAPFNLTSEQLSEALAKGTVRGGPYFRYGLTLAGGERWETFASPNWQRFFDDEALSDGRKQIIAGSHERLLELLENSEEIWGIRIDESKTEYKELQDWEAMYWKEPMVGYAATCVFEQTTRVCAFNFCFDYRDQLKRHEAYRSRMQWCSSLLGHSIV